MDDASELHDVRQQLQQLQQQQQQQQQLLQQPQQPQAVPQQQQQQQQPQAPTGGPTHSLGCPRCGLEQGQNQGAECVHRRLGNIMVKSVVLKCLVVYVHAFRNMHELKSGQDPFASATSTSDTRKVLDEIFKGMKEKVHDTQRPRFKRAERKAVYTILKRAHQDTIEALRFLCAVASCNTLECRMAHEAWYTHHIIGGNNPWGYRALIFRDWLSQNLCKPVPTDVSEHFYLRSGESPDADALTWTQLF